MNSRKAWSKLILMEDAQDLAGLTEWSTISYRQFRRFWEDYQESMRRFCDAYLEFGGLPKRTLQQLRDSHVSDDIQRPD